MKTIIAAIAAALLAAACGPGATPQESTPAQQAAAPAEQAAAKPDAAAPPAAADAQTTPTPAMLVGRWGDNGDCSKDITFNADGSFTSYTGGSGRWTLNGDRMTMTGAAGAFEVRVSIANQNTLIIGNADGSYGLSQRC